jgi:hypothetical protein
MAFEVGTNSYVTEAEADAYALTRPLLTAWAGIASSALKESYLIEAAIYLDASYTWKGTLSDIAQSLAWPRADVLDKEGREVADVPTAIKNAQIELAAMVATGALVESRTTGDIESVKAEGVTIKFVKGKNASEGERFAWVNRILSGLYLYGPGAGSANVAFTRG